MGMVIIRIYVFERFPAQAQTLELLKTFAHCSSFHVYAYIVCSKTSLVGLLIRSIFRR